MQDFEEMNGGMDEDLNPGNPNLHQGINLEDFNVQDMDGPQVKEKRRNNAVHYKTQNLLEDQSGIKDIFRTFVLNKETVDGLRFQSGHEVSDLKRIITRYRAWHLNHFPKDEYYRFVDKLRKVGSDKDVQAYMAKLRNHYKGEEILEEFNNFIGDQSNQIANQNDYNIQDIPVYNTNLQHQQNARVNEYDPNQIQENRGNADQYLKQIQQMEYQMPNSMSLFERLPQKQQFTQAQLDEIEKKRQIALSKKRKRQELELQGEKVKNDENVQQQSKRFKENVQNDENINQILQNPIEEIQNIKQIVDGIEDGLEEELEFIDFEDLDL